MYSFERWLWRARLGYSIFGAGIVASFAVSASLYLGGLLPLLVGLAFVGGGCVALISSGTLFLLKLSRPGQSLDDVTALRTQTCGNEADRLERARSQAIIFTLI